jgi:DNA-binding transcriptional LysR family regulator
MPAATSGARPEPCRVRTWGLTVRGRPGNPGRVEELFPHLSRCSLQSPLDRDDHSGYGASSPCVGDAMELNLAQVSAFVALAEEGHFGRAARRLYLTTPAVSKRIQGLERQLRVQLLIRDPVGGVALTSAGEQFVGAAVLLLQQATDAERAARADGAAQHVLLGYPAGVDIVLRRFDLAGAARDMRSESPGARLSAVPVPFGDINRVLLAHRVDVMIIACPMQVPGVVSEPLPVTDARIALVPARHPLADASTVAAEEVGDYPMLFSRVAPTECMELFWLADLRPRREARLVAIEDDNALDMLHHPLNGNALMLNLSMLKPDGVPAHLTAVAISGAARIRMHAAYRAEDRRTILDRVLTALRRVGPPMESGYADGRPDPSAGPRPGHVLDVVSP